MRFVWKHFGAIAHTLLMLGIVVPPFLYIATMKPAAPTAADHAALARLVDMTPVGSIGAASRAKARLRKH